ncbi:predicted protein, partial [Nematostella vectensis]
LYKRGFAIHMNIFSRIHTRAIAPKKEELFMSLKNVQENIKGDILEIGCGTGANFPFFPEGSSVIALDPNPNMGDYFLRNADEFPNVTIKKVITGVAEDMSELADNSVAAVVCTLTLCSVSDIEATLREVKRVLKQGGCFYYLEHVADAEGNWTRWFQQALDNVWKYLSDGCSCARDSYKAIDEAGFSYVFHERFYASRLTRLAWLMRPHLIGYAVK